MLETTTPKTGYQELEDAIAALRIADEATAGDWAKFGRVAHEILMEATPETPDDNRGGLDLLLGLQRQGVLKFEVDNGN